MFTKGITWLIRLRLMITSLLCHITQYLT